LRITQGPVYVDSSALVKVFVPEPASSDVQAVLHGREDLFVSDLVITEVISSVARRAREGSVAQERLESLAHTLLDAVADRVFRKLDLTAEVHREAERLILALPFPMRAADSLHLALAAESGCRTVLTFDSRLSRASSFVGLDALP
jgi:predicted nucleic acid-binding protein